MRKNCRICPSCGKDLILTPPTMELLPERFGESQNGIKYYFYSNPRLHSYIKKPQSNYTNGKNNIRVVGDIRKNAFFQRSPKIVAVNNTLNKLQKDGFALFSYELVFFCKHCKQKLALNFNPFSLWAMRPFQMCFWLIIIIYISPFWCGIELTSIRFYFTSLVLFFAFLLFIVVYQYISYLRLMKYSSNFVITDKWDNLFLPYIEIIISFGSLDKKFLHESNIFSAKLEGEDYKLYLVKKASTHCKFHICGIEGEQERMIRLIRVIQKRGEEVTLSLTFEGKLVGDAKVLEIYDPPEHSAKEDD